MKIAVVGAGGLGGYFGARLVKAGTEVHFLEQGAHLAAMRDVGLSYESLKRHARLTRPRDRRQHLLMVA